MLFSSRFLEVTGADELDPRVAAVKLSHRLKQEEGESRVCAVEAGRALRGSVCVDPEECKRTEVNCVNLWVNSGG